MKRRQIFGCFVVWLICFALPAIARQTNTTQQPFTITISADHPEVKAGSRVCVLVHLVNSSKDLPMSHVYVNGMDAQFRYEIRDERGNVLPKKVWTYPVTISPHGNGVLKGNDALSTEQCPSMLYDMTKPGEYKIQVFRPKSDNPKDGEIESNIATVTVVR